MKLSVVICSHNSRLDYLQRVLDGLRAQTLPAAEWELVVVDNASREPLAPKINLSWHPHGRVVRNDLPEAEASLIGARTRGTQETTGEIIIFVDDDNVLAPDYLEKTLAIATQHPQLGAWSGQIILAYEDPARRLPPELEGMLCFRSISAPLWSNSKEHYDSTPWGAGLCVRRAVAEAHRQRLDREPDRRRLDPVGRELRFGGDTDLVQTGLLLGYGKGVFPELQLTHLIPARRCEWPHVQRAIEAGGYSAALHGWLETGVVDHPRTDWRYRLRAWWEWPRLSRWGRLHRRLHRQGHWRAYHELKDSRPARRDHLPPNPTPPSP